MMRFISPLMAAVLVLKLASVSMAAEVRSAYELDAVPAGYHLQECDDCGVADRQPHFYPHDVYTFPAEQVTADEKARTVAVGAQKIEADYAGLTAPPYVLAITYANEAFNHRVQSIWAGDVQLQGAHELPKGKSERLVFRVPPEAIHDGKLHLEFRLEAAVNVVVSVVELWSTAPASSVLHLTGISGIVGNLEGGVLNVGYDPQADVAVQLDVEGTKQALATTKTDAAGKFQFDRAAFAKLGRAGKVRIAAHLHDVVAEQTVPLDELFFDPIRYRPRPSAVAGIDEITNTLDGVWKINLTASDDARAKPLTAAEWRDIRVPGQWVEQGFDVPMDKPALMAREFTVPAQWKGQRVILRFDAIHAGTEYWLNGKRLGTSENLFTPVEWDVTDVARFGETNRLDLKMLVATPSEQLSYSSNYASHSLGGIDRSVRLFVLPPAHVSTLHLDAGLDERYENGDLKLDLGIAGPRSPGLSIQVRLLDAAGKPVSHSAEGPTPVEAAELHVRAAVPHPLKWNAEQPNLYKLVIELRSGDVVLERIERDIGFRKIEAKNAQLYVNGAPVKLAGVCRHEVDPLTGRADTARHAEEDVRLFKGANLNYIRTSHYPPTDEFLAAADKLGVYVECEAPLCWLPPLGDLTLLRAVLTPTAARIDYCHTHPSIIVWSIANESNWSRVLGIANQVTKSLDPTRPTTLNHAFGDAAGENCDIVNRHYLPMPFDATLPADPRPFMHGECFFVVYHERTDVGINPALRELWATGNAEPSSAQAQAFSKALNETPNLHAGVYPGAWSYVVASKRFIGTVIWSGIDDQMFTPDGKKISCEAGNAYWGIIDGWRRPKPELWLAKFVFSPVWFPTRHLDWNGHDAAVRVPVENRYSFTNLGELSFNWELGDQHGTAHTNVAPSAKGELEIPIPPTTKVGDALTLHVTNRAGDEVNVLKVYLGTAPAVPLPAPTAGAPTVEDQNGKLVIKGDAFAWAIDKHTGEIDAANPAHRSVAIRFPRLHVTRFDYGDLVPAAPPYALLPDEKTRVIDGVSATAQGGATAVTVTDHFRDFTGHVTWLIDRAGVGDVSYDYHYTGPETQIRELGVRLAVKRDCDQLNWHRWSEWDVFPPDHVSRTVGQASALRDPKYGPADAPEFVRPTWPWSLDQNELGTRDFRSVRFNVIDESLQSSAGTGVEVRAHADAHVRACLAPDGVLLHVLSQCRLAPMALKNGDTLAGHYSVSLKNP